MSVSELDETAQVVADAMGYGTTWHWVEEFGGMHVEFHTELHLRTRVSKAELAAVNSEKWLGNALREETRRMFKRELGFEDEIRELHENYRREVEHMMTEIIYWKQLAEDRK